MANNKVEPPVDPYAERNRVIRQRNIALGLTLTFFALLFFAITVVKMKHPKMPHKTQPASTMAPAVRPTASPLNGQ